jgi:hypothetical protein
MGTSKWSFQMKQRGHTWIALRAVDLIAQDPKCQGLATILGKWAKHSYLGCWLPDMAKFKKGHGVVGNHTFKNAPYKGENKSRFVLEKEKLLSKLDDNLALKTFIKDECDLPSTWWKTPFKAEQNDGEHLPDCLSSLFDTIADMLLLGDADLDNLVPGDTGYAENLNNECGLAAAQVAPFFFMLSHYVADCFMPCHADKRKLSAFDDEIKDIHCNWEKHWEKKIGTYFDKSNLSKSNADSSEIIAAAKSLDKEFGVVFDQTLAWGDEKSDVWDMAICWCRASFAFICHVFPVKDYPYDSEEVPAFGDVFAGEAMTAALAEYDRIIFQSAVYAVASTWKRIWGKF